jgi:hypothetical protein
MQDTMTLYFAYGSNMDIDQLTRRVGEIRIIGVGSAAGFQLRFNKRSIDGSGKANLVAANGVVEGVLFEMSAAQFARLDDSEKGYHRKGVNVATEGGILEAVTYFANSDRVADGLRPTEAYLALIVAGAERFGLTEAYRQRIIDASR